MFSFLQLVSDYLWTYVVITALVFCALYFTIRIRGLQFTHVKDMLRVIVNRPIGAVPSSSLHEGKMSAPPVTAADDDLSRIGSFQAFAVSLSSRVGTGNLAGVASAIFIGGPGAIFWMWMMSLFGAATAFVEATLAQLYKKRGTDSYYGGPAYYMQHGLHNRWLGLLFAVLITITFGMANQIIQSNTLCTALSDSFQVDIRLVGIVLTLATLVIIFGGIRRISHFASIVVPFMAIGYVLIALYVILTNLTRVPDMFRLIIDHAFGLHSVVGGGIGIAIMQGVKRGLFSNEAGEGSAPNAAAIAHTSHPVKQGLLQAFGVFMDTIVVCTCTAFIILLSGLYDSSYDGILLTKYALETHVGSSGGHFITLAIFLFAYSTIIANYFYGETNIRFITKSSSAIHFFRIITGFTIMSGSLMTLQEAWSIVDIAMGVMTLVNLYAIVRLSPKVFFLVKDYLRQRRAGNDPQFHRTSMPDEGLECW